MHPPSSTSSFLSSKRRSQAEIQKIQIDIRVLDLCSQLLWPRKLPTDTLFQNDFGHLHLRLYWVYVEYIPKSTLSLLVWDTGAGTVTTPNRSLPFGFLHFCEETVKPHVKSKAREWPLRLWFSRVWPHVWHVRLCPPLSLLELEKNPRIVPGLDLSKVGSFIWELWRLPWSVSIQIRVRGRRW